MIRSGGVGGVGGEERREEGIRCELDFLLRLRSLVVVELKSGMIRGQSTILSYVRAVHYR